MGLSCAVCYLGGMDHCRKAVPVPEDKAEPREAVKAPPLPARPDSMRLMVEILLALGR